MLDRDAFHQRHLRHLLRQVKGSREFQPVPHVTAPPPAAEKAEHRVVIGERMRRPRERCSLVTLRFKVAHALEVEAVRAGQRQLAVSHFQAQEVGAELLFELPAVCPLGPGLLFGGHTGPLPLHLTRERRRFPDHHHAQLAVKRLAHELFGNQLHVVDNGARVRELPPQPPDAPCNERHGQQRKGQPGVRKIPTIAE